MKVLEQNKHEFKTVYLQFQSGYKTILDKIYIKQEGINDKKNTWYKVVDQKI